MSDRNETELKGNTHKEQVDCVFATIELGPQTRFQFLFHKVGRVGSEGGDVEIFKLNLVSNPQTPKEFLVRKFGRPSKGSVDDDMYSTSRE